MAALVPQPLAAGDGLVGKPEMMIAAHLAFFTTFT
jgi:hypothetical protein